MPSTSPGPSIRARDVALYSIGSLATGIFSTVPSVLLLYFCTEVMGISAILAGLIVFVPKVWGLFWDPYVGSWSDRSMTPFGRRRPFIAVGALGTSAAFVMLFSPPNLHAEWSAALWVACAYAMLVTAYALFAVPYVAVPAEVAAQPSERARLVGWRVTSAMLGVLAGAALSPVLVDAYGGGRHGYAMMSLWGGGLAGLAMACPLAMLRSRDAARRVGAPSPAAARPLPLRIAMNDAAFRPLLAAYVLLLGGAGMTSAATPYFITGALKLGEAQIGTVLGVMLAVTSVSAPLVSPLGRRFGYLTVLSGSMLIYVVAAIGIAACVLTNTSGPQLLGAFGLAGLAFAGLQVLPYALVTELIHARVAQGEASEGSLTGLWTAAEKLGLAIGPLLGGVSLFLVGGDPHWLAWPMIGLTALLFLLCFPLLRAFRAAAPTEVYRPL